MKVTLFHASDEKSGPTMADPTSATVAKLQSAPRQKSVKFAATACGLRPSRKPKPTSAEQRSTLAKVKTFCTVAPVRMPRVLTIVSRITTAMARSCCVVRPILPEPSR